MHGRRPWVLGTIVVARSSTAIKYEQTPVMNFAATTYADASLRLPRSTDHACIGRVQRLHPSFLVDAEGDEVITVYGRECLMQDEAGQRTWVNSFGFGIYNGSDSGLYERGWRWGAGHNGLGEDEDPRFHNAQSRSHSHLQECVVMSERSGHQDFTQGPLNPKLFSVNGTKYVFFTATPLVHGHSGSRPQCLDRGYTPHIAPIKSVSPVDGVEFGDAVALTASGMSRNERDWAPFVYKNQSDNTDSLMVVKAFHPHIIAKVDVRTGEAHDQYSEWSELIRKLAGSLSTTLASFSGGVSPTRVMNGGTVYFLSLLTFRSAEETVATYPYKMSAEPPFNILAVGKMLPLVNGFDYNNEKLFIHQAASVYSDGVNLVIGYNAGDGDSRVFKMSIEEFDEHYFGVKRMAPAPEQLVGAVTEKAERRKAARTRSTAGGRYDLHKMAVHTPNCDATPILCQAPFDCSKAPVTQADRKKWGDTLVADGKPNLRSWCLLPSYADALVENCLMKRDLYSSSEALFETAVLQNADELDASYCFLEGHCTNADVTDNTTSTQAVKICNKRYGDSWKLVGLTDVQHRMGPVDAKAGLTSIMQSQMFGKVSCAMGAYHCDVMYCKHTYCKKDYYKNKYGHFLEENGWT